MPEPVSRTLAAALLVLLSPLLAAAAFFVVIESGFPAVFRHSRVGQHGALFQVLKLRTMRAGVQGSPKITVAGDSRVTRVGRILRSTKLDELPQLWNVVRGEMSLVGPRPEVPDYVALWDASARDVILRLKPGITDPASLDFRREEEILAQQADPLAFYIQEVLPLKQRSYLQYATSRSTCQDMRIIVRTIRTVLFT